MANTTGQKFGGRKAGTPNKVTKNLKGLVYAFLESNIKNLQEQYDQLNPSDKLDFFQKLLKFAVPTQTASRIDFEKMSEEDLDNIINHFKNL